MKNRTEKVSIRTTESISKLIDETLKRKEYKFYTKSDIINLVLEEQLPIYAKDKSTNDKNK
mgnify:CR=1 FL=1